MQELTAHRAKRRRLRERFWVVSILTMIVISGFFGGWFFQFQSDLPLVSNIALFVLINVNVILLLLLFYLVLRNIVKLVFERKRNILGHKLRSRLVIAFVGLTLIPTIPLFWLATQFISFSLDYWFSHQVERSLEYSVILGKDYLREEKEDLAVDCHLVKSKILIPFHKEGVAGLEETRTSLLEEHHLEAVLLFDDEGDLLWQARSSALSRADMEQFRQSVTQNRDSSLKAQTFSLKNGREGLIVEVPFPLEEESFAEDAGSLIALRLLPSSITERLSAIASGYEDYLQLKLLHNPLKTSHFVIFSIATLFVVFAAVWFGFFLAKSITVPIQALVSATQCVAEGDLNVQLDMERHDEIGMLIDSFNKMVLDLRGSREELASAYLALQQSHSELEDRRRYIEIVLKNIGAVVVSVNAEGRIMTANESASRTFGISSEQMKGRIFTEFIEPGHMEIIQEFVDAYQATRQTYLEKQVQVSIGAQPMVLLVKASVLRDDRDAIMGVVVVLDNLTDLEKAQRMAAWREVARRIAHEIKNPLTPIQLSAQRLRRKYWELLEDQGSTFDECTRTIIQQVDHMKHLVNEFSNFARLPRSHPLPCDFPALVEESLAIYRHTYPGVSLIFAKTGEFPLLMLDHDQFRQVMMNLLDNAIHALEEEKGSILIQLSYDSVLRIARLECADTGHGLTAEDKLHMFEPYYSTKEKGTGLGLAIVAHIIADHNGFIRVRDNVPHGTVITVELPG